MAFLLPLRRPGLNANVRRIAVAMVLMIAAPALAAEPKPEAPSPQSPAELAKSLFVRDAGQKFRGRLSAEVSVAFFKAEGRSLRQSTYSDRRIELTLGVEGEARLDMLPEGEEHPIVVSTANGVVWMVFMGGDVTIGPWPIDMTTTNMELVSLGNQASEISQHRARLVNYGLNSGGTFEVTHAELRPDGRLLAEAMHSPPDPKDGLRSTTYLAEWSRSEELGRHVLEKLAVLRTQGGPSVYLFEDHFLAGDVVLPGSISAHGQSDFRREPSLTRLKIVSHRALSTLAEADALAPVFKVPYALADGFPTAIVWRDLRSSDPEALHYRE